jgi:hypothetical protein
VGELEGIFFSDYFLELKFENELAAKKGAKDAKQIKQRFAGGGEGHDRNRFSDGARIYIFVGVVRGCFSKDNPTYAPAWEYLRSCG